MVVFQVNRRDPRQPVRQRPQDGQFASLGVQLQETRLPEKLTVEEIIRLFRSFYKHGLSIDEVVSAVGLEEKRRARVGKLSGGQRQRLALACALVGDPAYYERFGFRRAVELTFDGAPPENFLVLRLADGPAARGRVVFHEAFWARG